MKKKFIITTLLLISVFFIYRPTHGMTVEQSNKLQTGSGNEIFIPYVSSGSSVPVVPNDNYDVRVNVPYFSGNAADHDHEAAIFWFGRVTASENYADIRFAYDNNILWVYMASFDQYMWYDGSPSTSDLTAWDGATLQIDLDGNTGSSPDGSSYRFDAALSWGDERSPYQAAYRWQNGQWVKSSVNFSSLRGYRGAFNDNAQGARGWAITFQIPFTSLGLSGRPADGTIWGAGLTMHDRDSSGGPALADKSWPGGFNANQPSTWAQLHYGLPNYGAVPGTVTGSDLIRRDTSRGIDVPDAGLGGTTPNLCPGDESYIFNTWGNVSSYSQHPDFNIQNQSDVSDFPCFSKYYITFPLGTVPANKSILSARLILHHQGSAGDPGQAVPSLIQVLTIGGDWSENTITWNNAPLPKENVSRTWVDVPIDNNNWPKDAHYWDVTTAARRAYLSGQPLRLALYEADSEYHSGKYFTSSETENWNIAGRPALEIKWGN
jgi:hypothetical protein